MAGRWRSGGQLVDSWWRSGGAAMSDDAGLPAGFESLECFVAGWALADLAGRDARRGNSTGIERAAFYRAGSGLLEQALVYLDGKPLAALSGPDQRLMRLMLCLAHVALAEEVQLEDEERHAGLRSYLPFTVEN